jgi:hypothetical protein
LTTLLTYVAQKVTKWLAPGSLCRAARLMAENEQLKRGDGGGPSPSHLFRRAPESLCPTGKKKVVAQVAALRRQRRGKASLENGEAEATAVGSALLRSLFMRYTSVPKWGEDRLQVDRDSSRNNGKS